MKKCNKIVIFDWGGVIENNNQSYYNISKAIIDIMRKYKCKLTDQEILEVCTNGGKLFNTFIDDDEQTTIDWFNEIKGKLNIDEANKRKWKTCRADGFEFEKIKRSVEEFLEKKRNK